jgi:DNA-binding IclR family transcriptional regulator
MSSSLARSLAILELFSLDRPVWSADALIERLGCSRPTGYRYVRELVASGLLTRVGGGTYGLGARIIELDYLIRRTDPMLNVGAPIIGAMVARTGCEVMLAGLHGDHIVTTHQEPGVERLRLTFGRGRAMPLFFGAGSKAIVAYLPRPRLQRLYAAHSRAVARAKLGRDWTSFRSALAEIRRAGFATSHGELDPGFSAAAAPVFNADGEILGSVIAALSAKRLRGADFDAIAAQVVAAGEQISAGIAVPLRAK